MYTIQLFASCQGDHAVLIILSLLVTGLGKKTTRKFKSCIEKHVTPITGKEFDKERGDIESFLECCELTDDKIGDLETYLEDEEEITSLDELNDIEEDDLLKTGICLYHMTLH